MFKPASRFRSWRQQNKDHRQYFYKYLDYLRQWVKLLAVGIIKY